jgi:hypothetical protein
VAAATGSFFSQRLGELRRPDIDEFALFDLGDEAWDRPVRTVRDGASSNGTQTRSAASVFTGGGPAYTLALIASTPPRAKPPRQKRTVSSRTRNTSAIRALVQPSSVSNMARARSASPRLRETAKTSSAARCSSLALTGDLPAMSRPRESVQRRNHNQDPLVKFRESA